MCVVNISFAPQYFHKYCVAGMSRRNDPSCRWDREGAWGKLLAWRKRSSNKGIVLGPGVDGTFIGGLADEVQGFSGREVGERSRARFPRFVLDAACGVPIRLHSRIKRKLLLVCAAHDRCRSFY